MYSTRDELAPRKFLLPTLGIWGVPIPMNEYMALGYILKANVDWKLFSMLPSILRGILLGKLPILAFSPSIIDTFHRIFFIILNPVD